jgi:Ca2+-transporting ATPase
MIDNNLTDDKKWYQVEPQDALTELQVESQHGLSDDLVTQRREMFGKNEIIDRGGRSIWKMLWGQLTDTMVLVLFAAAVISILVSDWKDAIAIVAIVLLNTLIGLFQEYRAEKAMNALKQMASPYVKVRRNGKTTEIDSKDLVPGDIIFLEAGSKVPADARLIDSANIRVEEASLTGESEPIDKTIPALPEENLQIGDRTNMLYMGTTVTYGRGEGVVVNTGMATELGRIAEMIQGVEEDQTPLQKRMDKMGKTLAVVSLGVVALVFFLGLLRGENPADMILTAVALAVAAVPEGLPAVVAIALALGAQRMLKNQALIRKLPAVETLGSVTVISSDKTGTLTANQMQLTVLDVAGNTLEIDCLPGDCEPELVLDQLSPSVQLLLIGGMLNNDAQISYPDEDPGSIQILGDPTEGALLAAASKLGLDKDDLDQLFPRTLEVPFTSERKRMTTLHQINSQNQAVLPPINQAASASDLSTISFTKGAVDGLLEISSAVYVDGEVLDLDSKWQTRIESATEMMAKDGLRVLGLGFRIPNQITESDLESEAEQELVFVGLYGMMDPPRPEAYQAIQISQRAGIRTIMITGDHPLTAERIARDLGIYQEGRVVTGKELSQMNDLELEDIVSEINVFARVSPEHKLRIVTALQNKGEIVAMTGDGVNDAPALRKADIGVAMGITGTDVSKEASDMVLLDDNYATIVGAVREGRTIFENIRKFIKYTMTSNAGEVIVMLFAPFFGLPLPLTALQILWINLVTDGLPGLALSIEPTEKDAMQRPPIDPRKGIFTGGLGIYITWVGLLMGAVSLGLGVWGWMTGNPYWSTMVFTTITLSQMGHALAVRSENRSLFEQGLLSNKAMLVAVGSTLILQLLITYLKPMQEIFNTKALPPMELALSLSLSLVVFLAVEIEKWFKRNKKNKKMKD